MWCQADVCYASAFDDAEESPSDAASCVDIDTSSVEVSAAGEDSNIVTGGMIEVASAPSLLMMSASDDDVLLTEALNDLSLAAGADSKPQLDNAHYFYQGSLSLSLCPFYWPFSRCTSVSQYQNVSILDFIGAKDDGCGADSWSCSYSNCQHHILQSSGQIVATNKPTPNTSLLILVLSLTHPESI